MNTPAILTSPRTSLMLVFMVVMKGYTINKQLIVLQNDLDNADWRIRRGSQHRIDLINQMETGGLERKNVEG